MKPEVEMTCEEVLADLPLLVGGDLASGAGLDSGSLPPELQRRLKAESLPHSTHLSSCSSCSEELAALTRSREAFISLREEAGAPGLWPDVRAVLAAEGRLGGAQLAQPAPIYRFRTAAAAALLVCCGALIWMSDPSGAPETGGAALALEGSTAPVVAPEEAIPTVSLSLRPLKTDELALSEGAEIFGLGGVEEVATPLQTPGGASAAGMIKIR